MSGSDLQRVLSHIPSTEVVQNNIAVPSQLPQQSDSELEPPVMDFLPLPPSPTPSASSYASSPHNGNIYRQGTYHARSMKTESPQPPFSHNCPVSHHHQTRAYSYNYHPSNKPQVRSTGWPVERTLSPRGIRLSPLPPSRRLLTKKLPLACLFCRQKNCMRSSRPRKHRSKLQVSLYVSYLSSPPSWVILAHYVLTLIHEASMGSNQCFPDWSCFG